MSSLPVPSPDQRFQQLESAVFSLIAQVAELTSELQSLRSQRDDLQQRLEELEEDVNVHQESAVQANTYRLSLHNDRLDALDGGPDEQQDDDSD
jgi:chromosome segregation ATPase